MSGKARGDFPYGNEPFSAKVDTWRSIWLALALVRGQDGREAMDSHYRQSRKEIYLPRMRRAAARKLARAQWRDKR